METDRASGQSMLRRLQGLPGTSSEQPARESRPEPPPPQSLPLPPQSLPPRPPLPPLQQHQSTGSGARQSAQARLESMLRRLPLALRAARTGRHSGAADPSALDQLEATPREGDAAATSAANAQNERAQRAQRAQRLSGAIAGSIILDLLDGALRAGDNRQPPASEEAIAKLVRKPQITDGASCPVCLMDFEECAECDQMMVMPCGHCFHEHCLTKWLRSHNTCPVCRHAIEPISTMSTPSFARMIQSWRSENRAAAGDSEGSAGASAGHLGRLAQAVSSNAADLRSGQPRMLHVALLQPMADTPAAAEEAAAAPTGGQSGNDSTEMPRVIPAESETQFSHLSVSEMKRRLTALGVNFSRARGRRVPHPIFFICHTPCFGSLHARCVSTFTTRHALVALLRQYSQQAQAAAPASSPPLQLQVPLQLLPSPPLTHPPYPLPFTPRPLTPHLPPPPYPSPYPPRCRCTCCRCKRFKSSCARSCNHRLTTELRHRIPRLYQTNPHSCSTAKSCLMDSGGFLRVLLRTPGGIAVKLRPRETERIRVRMDALTRG